MAKITIDGKEYDLDKLSEEAKVTIGYFWIPAFAGMTSVVDFRLFTRSSLLNYS